jgi:hypothetical protein
MNELPIALESKDLLGLLLLLTGTLALTAVLLIWPRLRLPALFVMTAGAALTARFDLNIMSAYWYRGTTRGFEVTLFDVFALGLLFSSILLPREGESRWYWPKPLGLMVVFMLYCAAITAVSEPFIFGLYEISKLARGMVFFLAAALVVRRERDVSVLVVALAVMVILEGLTAARERVLLTMYRPAGTLEHPNSLSMYLCLVTPLLVAAACSTIAAWIRWLCWLAVIAAACTMVLTLSRAGLPIFSFVVLAALALCGSWRPTPGKLAVGSLAVVAIGALVLFSWPLLTQRFGQATLREEYFDAQGESRGYYFRQAAVILDDKPFGVGLNNWSYWVSKEYGKPLGMRYENYDNIVYAPPSDLLPMYRWAAPAHNLGALTAAELGWAGLALLLVLWFRWFTLGAGFLFERRPDVLHRLGVGLCLGMLAVFLQSFTEWTFRQTQIFLTFNILAGVLASLVALKQRERAEVMATEQEVVEEWPLDDAGQPLPQSAYQN